MRTSEISRVTAETDIRLSLDLDGRGASDIDTGVGFLDHMLTLLAKHARFDLYVQAKGDNYVDDHHTVEDVGIVLGQAFAEAIDLRKGLPRVRAGDTDRKGGDIRHGADRGVLAELREERESDPALKAACGN